MTVRDLCAIDCAQKSQMRLFIAFLMIVTAFIMVVIASANAAYRGCYKTAIMGTLLSTLIM
jgi:hypothetical protein